MTSRAILQSLFPVIWYSHALVSLSSPDDLMRRLIRSIKSCHSWSVASASGCAQCSPDDLSIHDVVRKVCGYPILLGFCRKVKHPFPFWLVQLQQQGHPFQIFLRRSRAAVILNVAHIDRRQVQLCRHAAERQAARHTLLPKEAAKGLFHAFHLLVRSLDWEQCQYSKHLFD